MSEPICTCTELERMTVCCDIRNEPHLVGCPRWGTPKADARVEAVLFRIVRTWNEDRQTTAEQMFAKVINLARADGYTVGWRDGRNEQ